MSDGKLYYFTGSVRGEFTHIVANYEGLKIEHVETNPSSSEVAEGNWDGFVKKFPFKKVPTYEKDGFLLTETIAIAHYLSKKSNKANLFGKTAEEEASVFQWVSFVNQELVPRLFRAFAHLRPVNPTTYIKPTAVQAEGELEAIYPIFDNLLKEKTYLVGERITAADIILAIVVLRSSGWALDKEWRTKHAPLARHMYTVINQPHFLALKPNPVIVETALKYIPPKKEAAPKKEEAPKAPPAKKEKSKKEDEEEDEPLVPAEPKAKHPCEALGPATCFPFDEWKRQYSNNDTKVAMAWLEEKLNPQEYSLWKVVYKYPEELTQVYMSSNLIGGFHNRLEASRKYLFGSAGVYGEPNKSKIQGVYMVRGAEYLPVFEVAPDHESYEFSPLDLQKDREFIEGCWAWTNEYDGLKYADGKVFK